MTNVIPKRVLNFLRNIRKNWKDHKTDWALAEIQKTKQDAVAGGHENIAKQLWIYETILRIQDHYVNFFHQAKEKNFYKAWCSLERAEIAFLQLRPHYHVADAFALTLMQKLIPQFQDMFPYGVFFSPEFVVHRQTCGICGERVTAIRGCGHRKGEIYQGEMCSHCVEDAEFLAVSFVTNPVQKYSVPFLTGDDGESYDHHDYGLVDYVVSGLLSPFIDWDYEKTVERHPHSLFKELSPEDECPCESGKPYEVCCLRHPAGVLRPHMNVLFSEDPPSSLPRCVYPGERSVRADVPPSVRNSRKVTGAMLQADQEM